MLTCRVEGCGRATRTRTADLCNAHYFRVRRNGRTGPAEISTGQSRVCSVEDCRRISTSKGMCWTHRRRFLKRGSTDYVPPTRYGPENGAWRGDDVGYTRAHERVREARGPARNQVCVDCGGQARHWSYDHGDPDERRSASGLPYSVDVDHYDARCVPCHKRLDLALRRARPACGDCNSETGGVLGAARKAATT